MSNTVYQIKKRRDGIKAKQLRREGFVPGVVYGGEYVDSLPIEMTFQEVTKLLKENTQSSIIKLDGTGKQINVIVKEVQLDNLTHFPVHVDFQSISLRQIITVTMPINITGEEKLHYKDLMYQPNLTEIDLTGPAEDIPDTVEIDVSNLEFEDKVVLSDISVPEGIELEEFADDMVGIVLSSQSTEEEDDTETDEEATEVPLVEEEE